MAEQEMKGDLEVIFSEDVVKVKDKEYHIKPWTLKQLMKAWPILSIVIKDFKLPEGSTVSDIPELLFDDPQRFLQILLPVIIPFLAVCLSLPEEEVEEIEIGPASVIVLKVLGKNVSHLKNFLNLAMSELMMVAQVMTKPPSSEDLTP